MNRGRYAYKKRIRQGFYHQPDAAFTALRPAPEKAFYGAADHLTDLIVPEQFRGTEIDELIERLRKLVIWHQPGIMDKEDAADIRRLLNQIGVAIDRHLGIPNPDAGKYD